MSKIQQSVQDASTQPDVMVNLKRNVNLMMEGSINSIGTITLTNGGTTTTLMDKHINPQCVILFSPQTSDAAAVFASLWYDLTSVPISGPSLSGQITLHHTNPSAIDATFGYVIFT